MSEQLTNYHNHIESPFAKKFGRVITAMVTPFKKDERVDYASARHLSRHLLAHGSDSLVIAGTTGESATLSHNEQQELFWQLREEDDSATLIAGVGSNSTKEAVSLTSYVTRHGLANALLAVSPYYNRPSQYGIYDYFSQIAESTDLPVVLYNIPVRTGRPIEDETIVELAERHSNIIALKDAGGNTDAVARLVKSGDLPQDFVVYSGDDSRNLELAKVGAVGAISVASHWAGQELQQMYQALDEDDIPTAEGIDERLQESYAFESLPDAPNPHPTKALLTELKVLKNDVTRSPMTISGTTRLALAQQARVLLHTLQH